MKEPIRGFALLPLALASVSLSACSRLANTANHNCYWTQYVSEEHGGELDFQAGYYARGGGCKGSYCDDMNFYICSF